MFWLSNVILTGNKVESNKILTKIIGGVETIEE